MCLLDLIENKFILTYHVCIRADLEVRELVYYVI